MNIRGDYPVAREALPGVEHNDRAKHAAVMAPSRFKGGST